MFVAVVVIEEDVYQSHEVVSADEVEGVVIALNNQGYDDSDIVKSPECDTEDEAEAWVLEQYPEASGFEDTEDDVEEE